MQDADEKNRRALGRQIRRYISEFDRTIDHLLFGSDWIMLGKEKGHASFATELTEFLKTELGLSNEMMDRVLKMNAVRFLGLKSGNQARERLDAFYRRHDLNEARLKVFDQAS
jgi:hypothetical protein